MSVLDIEGRIVLGEESNAFREKVKSLLAARKKIILDIARVTYIDSADLGTLVAAFHSARSQGPRAEAHEPRTNFKESMQLTKLLTVFDTYDGESIQSLVAPLPSKRAIRKYAARYLYCAHSS